MMCISEFTNRYMTVYVNNVIYYTLDVLPQPTFRETNPNHCYANFEVNLECTSAENTSFVIFNPRGLEVNDGCEIQTRFEYISINECNETSIQLKILEANPTRGDSGKWRCEDNEKNSASLNLTTG